MSVSGSSGDVRNDSTIERVTGFSFLWPRADRTMNPQCRGQFRLHRGPLPWESTFTNFPLAKNHRVLPQLAAHECQGVGDAGGSECAKAGHGIESWSEQVEQIFRKELGGGELEGVQGISLRNRSGPGGFETLRPIDGRIVTQYGRLNVGMDSHGDIGGEFAISEHRRGDARLTQEFANGPPGFARSDDYRAV